MIEELVNRVFFTRNLTHIAHWGTKSYAQHLALGDLYDGLIGSIDGIVECYQGRYGLIKPFLNTPVFPKDLLVHLKDEVNWIADNHESISKGCSAIGNLIDGLLEVYIKAIYKLQNLN